MTDKILEAVSGYEMLQKGDAVLCAVSGGADSMAMLCALCELSEKLKITVFAAHLNHCLRKAESERDRDFVIGYCKENNIELIYENIDVREQMIPCESIETAARRVRYDFLDRAAIKVAEKTGAKAVKIATAHTVTDSAETVIMNFIRGTTLNGLCGISPMRGNVIRPLIRCTREDTESFCKSRGINFVTDSTNLTDDCRRNYIRHNIMPEFLRINPSFYDAVTRMLQSNIAENDYLERQTDMLIKSSYSDGSYDCRKLLSADEVIRLRAISGILKGLGIDAVQQHFVLAVNKIIENGGKTELTEKTIARCRNGRLEFIKEEKKQPVSVKFFENPFGCNFFAKEIKTELISSEKFEELIKVNKMLAKQAIDFDKIVANPQIRSRTGNDEIRLKGRGVTKTLKKLFNEAKIPPEKRIEVPVLADDGGVLWIDGFGVCERAAVSKETKTVMVITVSGK